MALIRLIRSSSPKMKHVGINIEIAFTFLSSRRRQTAVAAMGVTFGMSMFIFINSLISGTNEYFEKATLSTIPHIRLYQDNIMCTPDMLNRFLGKDRINLISNPELTISDNRIYNPGSIVQLVRQYNQTEAVSMQVSASVIYSNGNVQQNGNVFGVNILEQDKMFDISSTMLAGSVNDLNQTLDGILIGSGLSQNLNLKNGDRLRLTSSNGSTKSLKVVGIFQTTIKNIDNTKTYVNIPQVQQLLKKDRSYITDIYVNIRDHNKSAAVALELEKLTGYNAEAWQVANQQSLAARRIRDIIANSMVLVILLVAGFGIYNILNMVIYEKIKEIAILKANGFAGRHVVSIFLWQAFIIGLAGSIIGEAFGWIISLAVSKIYIGVGNVTYLPMTYYLRHYLQALAFGLITSALAGYIPAIKASKVDPVKIIRG